MIFFCKFEFSVNVDELSPHLFVYRDSNFCFLYASNKSQKPVQQSSICTDCTKSTHENNSNSSKKLQLSARSVKKLTQKRIKHVYLRCLLTDLLEIRSEGRSQDPFRMVFYAKLQFVSKKNAET